jgi:hypothetical protein
MRNKSIEDSQLNPQSVIRNPQSRGVSIIAAVFIIVVLAFMGLMFVSLITTGSFSAINDMQSAQALYIAEGGLQYTLALNQTNIPNYSTHGALINLGVGQFRVDTMAFLTGAVAVGATSITVDSTDSFPPPPGRITIDNEFIVYTAKNDATDTFTVNPVTSAHAQFNSVYPAARLSGPALPGNCTSPVPIYVDENPGGFIIPGIIFIDTEYFYCTGTASAPNSFTGCQRCYADSDPAAHPPGRFASQYVLTSTGRVAGISGNAERVVQIHAGPDDH